MADSDPVVSQRQIFYVGDINYRSALSEALLRKFASANNYVVDRVFFDIKFNFSGFFNANSYDNGYGGIEVIEKDCIISRYIMSTHKTGSSGINSVNVAVYDNTGAFVTNVFGAGASALSVSGSDGTNVVVGKSSLDTITPSEITINTAGHTFESGVVQVTDLTLLQGYMLVPFVVSNGSGAINSNLSLRLKEL